MSGSLASMASIGNKILVCEDRGRLESEEEKDVLELSWQMKQYAQRISGAIHGAYPYFSLHYIEK
jgi:hypothetical protein